jgi:hypothetical protein
MIWDEQVARLAEFQAAFGSDLKALDAEFLRFVRALPRK